MLKVTDSGCAQHPPRHFTLTGLAAALMGRLALNLLPTEAGYSYICEYGHTHDLTLQPREGNLTSSSPGLGCAGGTAPVH